MENIFNVYRGQHGIDKPKIHTKLPSISFGSSLKAAQIYASKPNNRRDIVIRPIILTATIKISNPIIYNTDDCFADFDTLLDALGEDFMWYIAGKHAFSIYNSDNWEENFSPFYTNLSELKQHNPKALSELYIDAYILLDDEDFINRSKRLGFDGAIHIGNGKTRDELEFRVFSTEQISNLKEVI